MAGRTGWRGWRSGWVAQSSRSRRSLSRCRTRLTSRRFGANLTARQSPSTSPSPGGSQSATSWPSAAKSVTGGVRWWAAIRLRPSGRSLGWRLRLSRSAGEPRGTRRAPGTAGAVRGPRAAAPLRPGRPRGPRACRAVRCGRRGAGSAEVVSWDQLTGAGGYAGARDRGTLRLEGRDYVVAEVT